ncbi:30S ribosomal protein S3 [candidate division NPL-UPA2 bacterium Unc8]|uniref:Small ribosomal subunit protein uS3 n=1 Tax=candidate division NPL-UPA2 bacterium Unc8 TaxID=1980939 RepID=A0A399FY10_UNCN2|nr:MAG: 30S ribosomal protein S3 [candidate division NPL-UPA2 bacterium Unc8]
MGQKAHPVGLRLGYIRTWDSRWFARRDYGNAIQVDIKTRKLIRQRLPFAGISRIEIERASDRIRITIHTAHPAMVVGRKGAEVDRLRDNIEKEVGKQVFIDIKEIANPALDARLVAENIAQQLQKRAPFRRAMKKAVSIAMKLGAKGVRVACSGRLAGAEMRRGEWYREGKVPMHTLRADIDYGTAIAKTVYGVVGVKVWIFKGEVLLKEREGAAATKKNKVS